MFYMVLQGIFIPSSYNFFYIKLNAGEFMLVVCRYNSHDSTKAYSKHQVSHIDVCMGAENFNIDIFIFNRQCAPCHKFTNMYKMYVQSTAAAFTIAVSSSMISTIFQCNFFKNNTTSMCTPAYFNELIHDNRKISSNVKYEMNIFDRCQISQWFSAECIFGLKQEQLPIETLACFFF